MTTTAILDLQLKADSLEIAHEVINATLTDTRAFPGCLAVTRSTGNSAPFASRASSTFHVARPSSLSGSSSQRASAPSGWSAGTTNVPAGSARRSVRQRPASRTS